jgi:hypothetical protein
MKKFRLFLALLFVPLLSFAEDVLFVMQDAGETFAYLPVMKRMAKNGESFEVIAGGASEEILAKEKSIEGRVHTFKEFGLAVDKSWQRERKASNEALKALSEAFNPKLVLGGVAFELQGQVYSLFRKKGARTYALWDNFGSSGGNSYFQVAHRVQSIADTLLVPSQDLSNAFQGRRCFIAGQPSLDSWKNLPCNNELKRKLGIAFETKVIAYVGGYGKEYEEGFRLFIKKLSEGNFEGFAILILPHPKADGSFEEKEIAGFYNIRLLKDVATKDAVAIADIVVCHQSTVAVQALAIPKPSCFVIPDEQFFQNPLIEKGCIKRLGERDDLEKEIQSALERPTASLYDLLGIPENGEETLYHFIEEELSR